VGNFTRSRSVRSPRRRSTSWVGGPSQVPTGMTSAGGIAWGIGTGTTEDGTTLIRTRGVFVAFLSSIGTIGDGFKDFSVGIGITTEEAFTVGGVTSLPLPLSDDDWDGWLYHQHVGAFRGSSTTELATGPIEAVRVQIDSKAMRKFEDGMVVFAAFETGVEVGVATLEVSGRTRLLVKLP